MFVYIDDEMTPATAFDFWAVAGVFLVMLPWWALIPVVFVGAAWWFARDVPEDVQWREQLP